ncbi:MAG: twin transmembrane helix small protein [Alphaproteobacteria bacterium]|nr:twin transmembrane helix small protein [Alphaproteobacteria bacterium]
MDFIVSLMPYVIGLALLATLGVLFAGLFSMMRGGEFSKKYSNKLMRMRVAFQGLAIVLFVLFAYLMNTAG